MYRVKLFRSTTNLLWAATLGVALGMPVVWPVELHAQKNAPNPGDQGVEDNSPETNGSQRYEPVDLLPVEQLILMLSNAAVRPGDDQQHLAFLGHNQHRGRVSIGYNDPEEIRSHWRNVASRVLARYTHMNLTASDRLKIEMAVELSVTEFLRTYAELREDFERQPDQKSRLAVLAGDDRYARLRQLGSNGLFTAESLVGRVIETILSAK